MDSAHDAHNIHNARDLQFGAQGDETEKDTVKDEALLGGGLILGLRILVA